MVQAKAIISLCAIVIIISIMITLLIDELGYQMKISKVDCRAIPPLSRVVHYTECMANLRCSYGDIIELHTQEDNKYFVVTKTGEHELTIEQVKYLEKKYNMRIMI